MSRSNSQLLVSFGIVAGSTAIGFGSNLISPLASIREFGIVAAVGIIFTFFTFGIFLPALKIKIDELRKKYSVPEFASSPLGDDGSILGKLLLVSAYISEKAPYIFIGILLIFSIGLAGYGTGVEAKFSNDLFLPPENLPSYVEYFPIDAGGYETPTVTNLIEEKFPKYGQTSLILYTEGDLRKDNSLEKINRIRDNPPNPVVKNNNGRADMNSILTIIEQSKKNPEIKKLIDRNDIDNNGIPDQNLPKIYNDIEDINPQLSRYITDSRGQTRIIINMEADSTNKEMLRAGEKIAEDSRLKITPTGGPIILREVSSFLIETTLNGLILALIITTFYLCAVYRYTDGNIQYGLINMIPVFVTVAAVAATMRYLGIYLNPITATTLSITIGIGVDYTIHMMHRITDEIENKHNVEIAIRESIKGTGGALFGSMVTTVFGIGSLTLSITPLLGQFGLIISVGVFYSFFFSIIMLPSLFRVYYDLNDKNPSSQ
jgi:predicted RND superfamily exporter protein